MRNRFVLSSILVFSISLLPFSLQSQERDPGFSFTGQVRADIDGYDQGFDVYIQEDNKIISIGATAAHPTFADDFVAVIRYNYDSSLDTTFGDSGITKLSINNASQTFYYDMDFQSDQKMVMGGQYGLNRYLTRLNTQGIIDTTFAEDGVYDFIDDDDYYRDYFQVKVTNEDKIRIFRRYQPTYQGDYAHRIQQFTSEGEIDSLFGINGIVEFELDTAFSYFLSNFVLLNNGKMLINGSRTGQDEWGTDYSEFVLTRRNADASLDSTFGSYGYTYSNVRALSDIAVHADGKIACVGTTGLNQQGTQGNMAISRYNANGSIDSTFNFDGHASLSVDVYADYANAVCIQNDGKIIVGGSFFNFSGGSVTDCVLARYNLDGSLDMDFGVGGVFKNGVSSGTDKITEMVIQDNYKIVYVGYANYQNFDIITGRIILGDLSASPSTNICLGDSTTLFAYSDSLIYGWAIDTLPDVLISTSDSLRVSPSEASSYLVYGINDTVSVSVSIISTPEIDLISDTTLCEGEELELNAFYPDASYLWQDSSIFSSYTVNESGTYFVKVSNQCASFMDTTYTIFNPLPIIILGDSLFLCEGEEMELNAFYEDANYLWQDSSISSSYTVIEEGDYWVETELNNCFYRDSISVNYLNNTYSLLEITTCDSALSPSGLYTWFESGTYIDTLSNSNFCDSVITIDLAITNSNYTDISIIACEVYTAGNGETFTESGQYEILLQNQFFCDSIIALDLQVIHLDTSVSLTNNTLSTNATNVNYQWIDCVTNSEIEGETSASYSPLVNGSYAIQISDSNCTSTSECIAITWLSISKAEETLEVLIYPNPTKNSIRIEREDTEEIRIEVIDMQGKVLQSTTSSLRSIQLDLSTLERAMYQIQITKGDSIIRKNIIRL